MFTIYKAAKHVSGLGTETVGYFRNRYDAEQAGNGGIQEVQVFDFLEEWSLPSQEELRASALAKLTPAEIGALGALGIKTKE